MILMSDAINIKTDKEFVYNIQVDTNQYITNKKTYRVNVFTY